jgi:hypothetical protein
MLAIDRDRTLQMDSYRKYLRIFEGRGGPELKRAIKLVLDWRKKLRTRADVYSTVETVLDDLPRIFSPELFQQKCDKVYQHVYDSYRGEGESTYESA